MRRQPKLNPDPCKTAADLIAAVIALKKPDAIPAGWMTAKEIAKGKNLAGAYCRRLIARGIKAGIVEKKFFRVVIGCGKMRVVPHYRQKQ